MTRVKFYKEKNFQDEKIEKIPKDWEVRKVEQCLEYAKSGKGIRESEVKTSGKFPVISQNQGHILGFSDEENLLISNDLPIVIFGDHTCEVKYIDYPFIVAGEGVKLLKTEDNVDELFFYYALQKYKPKPQHYRRHFRLLKDSLIPLPPLPEQKAIAKVLKDFDDLLEVIEEKIKTLQRIKKGLMEVYFTKGVFEHKEFKDTEIGKIPKDWEVKRLGEVCYEIKKIIKAEDVKNYKAFVGLEHIENGSIRVKNFSTVDEVKSDKLEFRKGNILYGKLRPYLDKCAIAEFDGVCSTDIIVIGCYTLVDNVFLSYLMHTKKFVSFATNTMRGTNHPRTSWNEIKKFTLLLPPLEEQKAIAQRLKTIDDQIDNLKSQKETLQKIKKKFMDLLLTGKVRITMQ